MNFSQKLGLFALILISVAYVYFSFFGNNELNIKLPKHDSHKTTQTETKKPVSNHNKHIEEKHTYKTVRVFVTDSKGKMRSVNRECDTNIEKSCFAYAIKELMQAPTKWEKSKGFSSEIPQSTKILSIREGSKSVMIDLSSAFEAGGGTESTYTRVYQLIKTANANTSLPVYLYINGRQANVIGGDGIMIKQPLTERSLDE